jgi:hypothetical protein
MQDYIEIPLTRGKFAKVDLEDFPLVASYRWRATVHARTFYAVTTTPRKMGHKDIYMHRFLINAPEGKTVDHVNGDGLDNRRHNVRFATPVQQSANTGRHKRNQSGFKGVSLEVKTGKWRARIFSGGKEVCLGQFPTKESAAAAYDAAAKRLRGEFARTNQHG